MITSASEVSSGSGSGSALVRIRQYLRWRGPRRSGAVRVAGARVSSWPQRSAVREGMAAVKLDPEIEAMMDAAVAAAPPLPDPVRARLAYLLGHPNPKPNGALAADTSADADGEPGRAGQDG